MNINLSDRNDYNNPIVVETVRQMFDAIYNDDIILVMEIFNRDIIDINTISPQYNYNMFLMSATYYIYPDIVNLLLNLAAYPNIQDIHDHTALDYANENIISHHNGVRVLTQEQLINNNIIINNLIDFGGLTGQQYEQEIDEAARNTLTHNSEESEPSDPDINILRMEAARNIQRRVRGRQTRQTRRKNRVPRRIGKHSSDPTREESMRRFTDHARILTAKDDELAGYLYPLYFNTQKRRTIRRRQQLHNSRLPLNSEIHQIIGSYIDSIPYNDMVETRVEYGL